MAIWSSLRSAALKLSRSHEHAFFKRSMSEHRTMKITPSRWQWHKFKDLLHYYTMVGLIPVTAIIFYANVFIGPAKLAEIPEGYTPKHWEYYRHPITRWIARYVLTPPQQEYEKYLHELYEQDEKMKLRRLEGQVMQKMGERNDYRAYYFKPIDGKSLRATQKNTEDMAELGGYLPASRDVR